jgi:hypothetical protein
MARVGRRLGGRLGGRLGTRLGGGDASAYAGDPLLVLDALAFSGTSAAFFGCAELRLGTAYTGPLIRIRKGTGVGATFANISYGLDNRVDQAAITAFAAGADCWLVTIFDQSGNGKDFTQATEARQCKIYDAATGAVQLGGLLAASFDPTASTLYTRTDGCGFSGAVAATLYAYGAFAKNPTGENTAVFHVGNASAAAGNSFAFGFSAGALPFLNVQSWPNIFRRMTRSVDDHWSEPGGFTARIGAGANVTTARLRHQMNAGNANDLPQHEAVNSGTISFVNTASAIGGYNFGGSYVGGKWCAWGAIQGDVSGAALDALDNFSAALHQIAFEAGALIWGQSNAAKNFVIVPSHFNDLPGVTWGQCALHSTSIDYWSPGGDGWPRIVRQLKKYRLDKRLFISCHQGESDGNPPASTAYQAKLVAWFEALTAAVGRSDWYIIAWGVHTSGTIYEPEVVNAAWQHVVTLYDGEYHDLASLGTLADSFHYGVELRALVNSMIEDIVTTELAA